MEQEHRMLEARILQGQGYTQVQIAEMLEVTDRTVRNYLKSMPWGRKLPVRGEQSRTSRLPDQNVHGLHGHPAADARCRT